MTFFLWIFTFFITGLTLVIFSLLKSIPYILGFIICLFISITTLQYAGIITIKEKDIYNFYNKYHKK